MQPISDHNEPELQQFFAAKKSSLGESIKHAFWNLIDLNFNKKLEEKKRFKWAVGKGVLPLVLERLHLAKEPDDYEQLIASPYPRLQAIGLYKKAKAGVEWTADDSRKLASLFKEKVVPFSLFQTLSFGIEKKSLLMILAEVKEEALLKEALQANGAPVAAQDSEGRVLLDYIRGDPKIFQTVFSSFASWQEAKEQLQFGPTRPFLKILLDNGAEEIVSQAVRTQPDLISEKDGEGKKYLNYLLAGESSRAEILVSDLLEMQTDQMEEIFQPFREGTAEEVLKGWLLGNQIREFPWETVYGEEGANPLIKRALTSSIDWAQFSEEEGARFFHLLGQSKELQELFFTHQIDTYNKMSARERTVQWEALPGWFRKGVEELTFTAVERAVQAGEIATVQNLREQTTFFWLQGVHNRERKNWLTAHTGDVEFLKRCLSEEYRELLGLTIHTKDKNGDTLLSLQVAEKRTEESFFEDLVKETTPEDLNFYAPEVGEAVYRCLLQKMLATPSDQWPQLKEEYQKAWPLFQNFKEKNIFTGPQTDFKERFWEWIDTFLTLDNGKELFGVDIHSRDAEGNTFFLGLLRQYEECQDTSVKEEWRKELIKAAEWTGKHRETWNTSYSIRDKERFYRFLSAEKAFEGGKMVKKYAHLFSQEEQELFTLLKSDTARLDRPPTQEHLKLLCQVPPTDLSNLSRLFNRQPPFFSLDNIKALYDQLLPEEQQNCRLLLARAKQWDFVEAVCSDVTLLLELELPINRWGTREIPVAWIAAPGVTERYRQEILKAYRQSNQTTPRMGDWLLLRQLPFTEQMRFVKSLHAIDWHLGPWGATRDFVAYLEEGSIARAAPYARQMTVGDVERYFQGLNEEKKKSQVIEKKKSQVIKQLQWIQGTHQNFDKISNKTLGRWIAMAAKVSALPPVRVGNFSEIEKIYQRGRANGIEFRREMDVISCIWRLKNPVYEPITQENQIALQYCLTELQKRPLAEACGYLNQIFEWVEYCGTRYNQEIPLLYAQLFPEGQHRSFAEKVKEKYKIELKERFWNADPYSRDVHLIGDPGWVANRLGWHGSLRQRPLFASFLSPLVYTELAFRQLSSMASKEGGTKEKEIAKEFVREWLKDQINKPRSEQDPMLQKLYEDYKEQIQVCSEASIEDYLAFLKGGERVLLQIGDDLKAQVEKKSDLQLRAEIQEQWFQCLWSNCVEGELDAGWLHALERHPQLQLV